MARDLLEAQPRDLLAGMPAEPQQATKKEKTLLEYLANDFTGLANNNTRGSVIGGLAQGAADLGAGAFQLGANLIGMGSPVNKAIADKEKEYQDARAAAGREGLDLARIGGNVAMTLPLGGAAAPASLSGRVAQGAIQGGAIAALNPVTNGGENYASDKLKDIAIGAGTGGLAAPVAAGIGRVINPKAANNADVKLLQAEGVPLTPGQALGGWIGKFEEKMQSVPVLGDAISASRGRANEAFNKAAIGRATTPLGASVKETGNEGIAAAKKAFTEAYDDVIPKLQLDTTDAALMGKLTNLRGMVQSLPQREAEAFDGVIAREIDARIAKNGVLSGQNLKDALAAIRDKGQKFSTSPDAYQSDLGLALKQLHKELLDTMKATNGANGQRLSEIDKAYANFKRVERAGASVGNAGEAFTPAQLFSATKALDKSKDKGAFARGDALMQDLAGAGKRVMGERVRNSGTPERLLLGGGIGAALGGMVNPAIPLATLGASAAYVPGIQNALVAALTKRPEQAAELANALARYAPAASAGAVASQ